jgi:hypothetical protein
VIRVTTTTDGSSIVTGPPGTAAPTVTASGPTVLGPVVVTAPPVAGPGLLGRARSEGITGPAVVAFSALLVALGAGLDLQRDATVGAGTFAAVVLAALVAPAVVRFRSLPTTLVLPPLLVAAAASGVADLGGQDRGRREIVLDVGTTLALHAPVVFAATALTVLVSLVRLGLRLARR